MLLQPFEQIVADSQFDKPTFYQYFAKKDIHLRTKPPMQHVNFAESRIAIAKRRLFSAIRAKKTNQWPQFLPKIITDPSLFQITFLRKFNNDMSYSIPFFN